MDGVRVNQSQAISMIAKGVDFYASALHGFSISRGGNTFKEDEARIRYVVKSYSTPIAWRLDDGTWVVPEEKYSATTSRHQSRVRRAVQLAEYEAQA